MKENLTANNRRREGRQVCFGLALAVARRQQHTLAAALAHDAYELSSSDHDRTAALIHEGRCLCEAKEFELSNQVLELANQYAEDKGFVAYHRGRVRFEDSDYIEALDRFEEALSSGSHQVPIEDMCFEMALSHIHIEEYGEARPYLQRSLRPGSKKSAVSFYLGICDLGEGEGEVQKALHYFRESLALGPTRDELGPILFYIGTCLKEMEQFEEAIDALQKAVEAEPRDLSNHNLLGFCYYKLKRHEEAVQSFRRAVEINPRSAIDWASLGSNLRDLGRIDEAIEMYKKALALDPTLGFARASLNKLTGQR
jgi:tetratricopeptide (TPR) repeat protein